MNMKFFSLKDSWITHEFFCMKKWNWSVLFNYNINEKKYL